MQCESSRFPEAAPASPLPRLCAVDSLPEFFPHARLTPAAVRNQIFRADDRRNSRGELLPGNGLGRAGAIIRVGRKVLIDVDRYGAWLDSLRTQQ